MAPALYHLHHHLSSDDGEGDERRIRNVIKRYEKMMGGREKNGKKCHG